MPEARSERSGEPVDPADGDVFIKLTREQVDQVMTSGSQTHGLSLYAVLAGLLEEGALSIGALEARYRAALRSARLSHALFRGLVIVAFLLSESEEQGVLDVARALELNVSTTHRYLATLVAFGLLVQDPETRKYRLVT